MDRAFICDRSLAIIADTDRPLSDAACRAPRLTGGIGIFTERETNGMSLHAP
ncbi:hypothetical protein T190_18310 [Sinorhizobium meliloti CCBAU 01290]|nr:hypothetical protein T190_18310 [Sinorhizobium meliloti CCBAU 01290]